MSDDDARIFTKEEMDDVWARMLHVHSIGDGIPYTPHAWAVPLIKLYRQYYSIAYLDLKKQEVLDCQSAYRAGWSGDFETLENYIGGQELAQDDGFPIRVERLDASLKTLKVRWSPVRR